MIPADFSRSVFVNCPFDVAYEPLFQATVFTVMDCGFHVRCARERSDAGEVRIAKIYSIIRSCRLGIHDLSRVGLDAQTNLPRFNMPLELGIFLGAKFLGDEQQSSKVCLVFDEVPFRYQAYLSDVAGQDIETHEGNPRLLVLKIRDWLASISEDPLPSGSMVWDRFETFNRELLEKCRKHHQRPDELTYVEYVRHVDDFRTSREDSLEVSGSRKKVSPDRAAIRNAVLSLEWPEPWYVILSKAGSGLTYLQAAIDEHGEFYVEYQDGSIEEHFLCSDDLTQDDVVEIFLAYADRRDSWRSSREWERINI